MACPEASRGRRSGLRGLLLLTRLLALMAVATVVAAAYLVLGRSSTHATQWDLLGMASDRRSVWVLPSEAQPACARPRAAVAERGVAGHGITTLKITMAFRVPRGCSGEPVRPRPFPVTLPIDGAIAGQRLTGHRDVAEWPSGSDPFVSVLGLTYAQASAIARANGLRMRPEASAAPDDVVIRQHPRPGPLATATRLKVITRPID